MTDSIYRVTEVIGTSPTSWGSGEERRGNRTKTLRDLRVGEIVRLDVTIEDGKVSATAPREHLLQVRIELTTLPTQPSTSGCSARNRARPPRGGRNRRQRMIEERLDAAIEAGVTPEKIRRLGLSKDSMRKLLNEKTPDRRAPGDLPGDRGEAVRADRLTDRPGAIVPRLRPFGGPF